MKDTGFSQFVLDQLNDLGRVDCRHMFGGFGVYRGDTFFGIISDGRLYFKTNEATREDYLAEGMEPFRPSDKMTLKSYYEVPADVLEDPEALTAWATRAIECQRAGGQKIIQSSRTKRKKKS